MEHILAKLKKEVKVGATVSSFIYNKIHYSFQKEGNYITIFTGNAYDNQKYYWARSNNNGKSFSINRGMNKEDEIRTSSNYKEEVAKVLYELNKDLK